jgi:L-asparaginase
MTRFSFPPLPLAVSVSRVAGPGGILQQSAEGRWKKTGEGEGGIIGIEYRFGQGTVVADFNCGGMFRAWVDDAGKERMMVFKEEF